MAASPDNLRPGDPAGASHKSLARRLVAIARATPWFLSALRAVRSLGVADACIGAGAVRNLVWDALHGHDDPAAPADVDVVHVDDTRLDAAHDAQLQRRLEEMLPGMPWEVTNQAAVHLWFEARFGHAVAPLRSLEEAVASWPETATAVALRLGDDDEIHVIAPLGLDDLFALVVRHNPARASVETYRERVATKRYAQRWPRVTVVPA